MAITDKEILKQFSEAIVPRLKEAAGSHFGETIEAELTDKSLTIYASPYISVLIDGRAPTKAGARAGSPTLQKSILSWLESKSITARANKAGKIPTSEQLSWAISKSIHQHGTKLYQAGGGRNIFDTVLTESRINNLLNLVGEKYYNEVQSINLPKIST